VESGRPDQSKTDMGQEGTQEKEDKEQDTFLKD
jgi:hypothetical protein